MSAVALLATLGAARPAGPMSAALKRDQWLKFPYGSEKVRGVNLGGWSVLEPWITPSIFEATPGNVVDGTFADYHRLRERETDIPPEYTFCQTLGSTEAHNRLSSHWNTWIVESDFANIAAAGLNSVRIPIGYWAVSPRSGDPYVQGAYTVLGKALDWANNHGLKVMIDLHGAPGSQNGFDNSGRKGGVAWTKGGGTIAATHKALNKIRDDHASHPAVAAIELLNEPLGPALDMDTVRQFYMDGWGNLKNSDVAVTFHDAFEGVNSWNSWGSGMWALLLDTHHYEIFDSGSLALGISQHIGTACGFGASMATNNKWTIAGEW